MAKATGLNQRLYIGGYDLSGDAGAVPAAGGGPALITVTGINKSAYERIGGIRDGRLSYMAYFNTAANQAHARLSSLPSTDVDVIYVMEPSRGGACGMMVAKQIDYPGTVPQDGSFTFNIDCQANGYGFEFGHLLTDDAENSTGEEDLTGYDDGAGAATDFGLQAYLQVLSFTGTSATVSIEDSDDDGSVDPYATVTGATFTAATGVTSERIATSATENVKEYLRVSIAGTYSDLDLVVGVQRNLTATAF